MPRGIEAAMGVHNHPRLPGAICFKAAPVKVVKGAPEHPYSTPSPPLGAAPSLSFPQ